MNDLINDLFVYFAKFVPKPVLAKMMIQPVRSQSAGYAQVKADVLALPDTHVIDELDTYVCSINENFVSERIRNAKGMILFVEYGKFSLDFTIPKGVQESISVTVAHNFSDNNNDNLQEILLMNHCLELLHQIIARMYGDQSDLDFCAFNQLLDFPVEVLPVEPTGFYGCGGWAAMFRKVNTILY